MKNNFSDWLINNPGTRLADGVLTLELRLPWYRSLPLSVLEFAELTVDGQDLPLAGATLRLNDHSVSLSQLPELTGDWWFVLDSAFLQVPAPGLAADQPHQLALLAKLYPPYIPMLTWATRGSAHTRPAAAADAGTTARA